jgi:hypothetical protein
MTPEERKRPYEIYEQIVTEEETLETTLIEG